MQPPTFAPSSLFSRIFHASPVAMLVTIAADGRCIDANQAFVDLVGRPREALIGRSQQESCPIEQIIPTDESLAGGPPDPGHIFQLRRSGGDVLEVIVSTQFEEWQGRRYAITFVQDLSGFRQAQNALRRSEDRFRLFFDNMPLPIFVFDLETTAILDVNRRAAEHYGYDLATLRGMTMLDILPPQERPIFIERLRRRPTRATNVGIRTHQKRDGTRILMDVTIYPLETGGRPAQLAVMQDVTEKMALQESLRAGEKYLQIFADVISDVIWDYDIATGKLGFTGRLRTMFGYEESEFDSLDWWTERLHPDDRGATLDSFDAALAGSDRFWETQYRFRHADGSYAYVLDRGYILRDGNGQATRSIGIMVDITRLVKLREAAAQAAQLERQRLARDLHDTVTQSLYSLSLMAEAARRHAVAGDRRSTSDTVGRLGELAQRSLREMYLLIYEFQPAALEKAGLAGALQARLDAVERRSGIRARLRVELDEELTGETRTQLFRIAEEALNNVLKHASASAVQVHIRSAGDEIAMTISDDGRGFDPAVAATTGGLGLISMRERVEKLGGRIEISAQPETGTIVRVNLDQSRGNHGQHDSDFDL